MTDNYEPEVFDADGQPVQKEPKPVRVTEPNYMSMPMAPPNIELDDIYFMSAPPVPEAAPAVDWHGNKPIDARLLLRNDYFQTMGDRPAPTAEQTFIPAVRPVPVPAQTIGARLLLALGD